MTGHQTTLAGTIKMKQTNNKIKRNDRSHTMIIKKPGHRISILITALYSLITDHCPYNSTVPSVPEPKLRCSKSKFKAFQVYSQAVPRAFQILFQVGFAQAFSKSLTCRKSEENYTKTTPKLSSPSQKLDSRLLSLVVGDPTSFSLLLSPFCSNFS